MGLFSVFGNFDRPGPGVNPDEPRKKGVARWWEIVSRDAGSFVLAGVLALAGLLPYLLGLYLSIIYHAVSMLLVTGLLGGLIAGPCCYGLIYTLLRSLRDNTSFWWYNWGKAVKRGWRDSLLPSVLCTVVYGMQIFVLVHLVTDNFTLGELLLPIGGVVLFTGIAAWMWPMAVLLDLPFPSILMNSVLLFSPSCRALCCLS